MSAGLIGVSLTIASQPAWAQLTQITAVQIQPTPDGLNILLGGIQDQSSQITTSVTDKTLTIEISNAQLRLSEGPLFRRDNPAANITALRIEPLAGNRVRITVVGQTALPGVTVTPEATGLSLAIAVTPPAAPDPATPAPTGSTDNPENIELVVTGQQEAGYVVEEATTATRTETPLRDIPQSIQVVPRQVIEDQQVQKIGDALRNVSGVSILQGYGGSTTNYTIRGFDSFVNLRDGFRDDGFYAIYDPANIERIEVLKGPASVLYGQLAPGGIVNFITKQPLRDPYYSGQFTAGSYNFYRPSIDFSGPLTTDGALRYRFNAAYESTGSFRDYVNGQKLIFAPVLTYDISDKTKLTVDFEYQGLDQTFDRGFMPDPRFLALPISRFLGEPSDSYDFESFKGRYVFQHQFNDAITLHNAFSAQSYNAKRENAQPLIIDGFLINDRFLPRRYTDVDEGAESYNMQTDLISKFKTGPVEHELVTGFELRRQQSGYVFRRTPFTPINIYNPSYGTPIPTEFDTVFDNDTTTDNAGIYLQNLIKLRSNLKLLVGGRFDFVTLRAIDLVNGGSRTKTNEDASAFSPRVGLVYQPIQPVSIYASFSRSFQPNFFEFTAPGVVLEPQRGTQYEIGIKSELLGGKLSATLAAYEITKTNIPTPDPNNPDFVIAAGEAKSRGVELDVIGEIRPGWNIIASYAYTDAFISQDNALPVGSRLVNVPRNSASLWTTYEIQQGKFQGLGFGGGLFFVGERAADVPNTLNIPAYVRADATVFYRRANYKVAVNVKNLSNAKYYDSQGFFIYPGEPLTVVGSFTLSF